MKIALLLFAQLLFTPYCFSEVKAFYNDNNKVEISWTNPSHMNVDYFIIERSKNGNSFKEILKVDGSENNGSLIEYFEIDNKPLNKKGYYRIKQVDVDGKTYFSEMVAATNINYIKPLVNLFINPKNKKKLKDYDEKNVLVVLLDFEGNEYISKVNLVVENRQLVVTYSNIKLLTGDYLISATSDDRIYGKKIIVKGNYSNTFYSHNR
jgi:hypothetical protein